MPYINPEERDGLRPVPSPHSAVTPGELNFQITCLIVEHIVFKGLSYTTINDVVGALDGCKAEFQRRVVAPYEDRKRRENGDVYPEELL